MSAPESPSSTRFAANPVAEATLELRAPTAAALLTPPFVLMLCVQFCFSYSFSTFFLLPKYLTRELHASSAAIGAVSSLNLFAGVLATPLIGAWIDRGARRPTIVAGAVVHALAAGAYALVHDVSPAMYALRIAHGLSYALVFNALVTLAADLAPPKKLGQAIGLCGVAGIATNAFAPAVGEVIADHRGWPTVFVLAGAASLVATMLALCIREPVAQRAVEAPVTSGAFALISAPSRAGAFVCSGAAGAAFGSLFTFTTPFALALGAGKVSGFFIGYTATALGVRLLLGQLADTIGRERVAFGALTLYGLVASMTAALRPSLMPLLGAGLGLAHGLLYPALNAIAAEGVPRARRGTVMSYFSACFYGGFALWVYALGWIAKSTGYACVFLLSGALVWSSILALPKRERARS